MNSEEARKKIETLGIGYSEDNFFKYVQSGDREMVELFLDAGLPPDIRNKDRYPAVLIASRSRQIDVGRLLLSRGASPEPLLNRPAEGKDKWDKMSASSAILSFISGILIAAVGGYFTYSYNQRQIDLNRTQSQHDAVTKEQANKVLELEAIQKLIPTLTSRDEKSKAAALIAIQDLAHPELSAHLAVLFKGEGSVQYLQQAATSNNTDTKKLAVQALSTIATTGKTLDSQMASYALSTVFHSTRASVVQVVVAGEQGKVSGAGVIVTRDGYILTSAHLLSAAASTNVTIVMDKERALPAQVVSLDTVHDLAILKVEGQGFLPVRLAAIPVQIDSSVITIGYVVGQPSSFVGNVLSLDDQFFYFVTPFPESELSGGPVLGSTGEVVGLVLIHNLHISQAIRSDVVLKYLQSLGIHFV